MTIGAHVRASEYGYAAAKLLQDAKDELLGHPVMWGAGEGERWGEISDIRYAKGGLEFVAVPYLADYTISKRGYDIVTGDASVFGWELDE